MSNSIGTLFRLTTFGESHGTALGGVVDGVPAGMAISQEFIQNALDSRRPGAGGLATTRREPDTVEILSGIFNGVTLGTSIGFVIRNTSMRPADYEAMRHIYRPSHADFTYDIKYGGSRDYRGGGRASARETACRVVGGAIAEQVLATLGITLSAHASRIGNLELPREADRLEAMTEQLRREGDSVGGIVECVIDGCPPGLGEPVFGKLPAMLAAAVMSIPAAKGFEYGDGFAMAAMRGSEANDIFTTGPDGHITTITNHSGGIQGGISNGMPISFRVAFKPVATILQPQPTVTDSGEPTVLSPRGRHDVSVVPRAVPVVKAMAAMTILDAWLMAQTSTITRP